MVGLAVASTALTLARCVFQRYLSASPVKCAMGLLVMTAGLVIGAWVKTKEILEGVAT